MSRSGSKYRNPYVLEARQRRGVVHEADKRARVEELRQKELDDYLQDMEHTDDVEPPCSKQWHFNPLQEKPRYCDECGVPTWKHGGLI